MKKLILLILIIIVLFACTRPNQTEIELRENINRHVNLNMFESVQKAGNLLWYNTFRSQYDFLSIIYLENSCEPCFPKFVEWQKRMDSLDLPNDYTVLFIIYGEKYEDFMIDVLDIEYVDDKFYVIMDREGEYLKQNKDIPKWINEASILIDAENKIKMVGAPWLNEDMTELFYKTVNSDQ